MAQSIRDVMTAAPRALPEDASIVDAARVMRDEDIGNVLVTRGGRVTGIVTDRDIAIRIIAEDRTPADTPLRDAASEELVTLSPDDAVEDAIRMMREKALRRVPVVDGGKAVGIVSIGDLAVERDSDSALADISAAEPIE